jgi:hypothetical protein
MGGERGFLIEDGQGGIRADLGEAPRHGQAEDAAADDPDA